jgi:hypothetical protein
MKSIARFESQEFGVQLVRGGIGHVFFDETVNSKIYVGLILSPFFDQMASKEKSLRNFMHDNGTGQTVNNYMNALWRPRPHDLSAYDFCLRGTLKR